MDSSKRSYWFDDAGTVVALGRWLVNDQFFSADLLQAYYEKPWKYDTEHEAWQEQLTQEKLAAAQAKEESEPYPY